MKLLFNYSKVQCIKPVINTATLVHIHKFHFTQQQKQQKHLEFSDSNTILESLSFQTLSPDPNAPKLRPKVEKNAWKRQNRTVYIAESASMAIFSGINESKSMSELHEQLEIFKQDTERLIKAHKSENMRDKPSIMDILNSIGSDMDCDEIEIEESNLSDKCQQLIRKKELNLIEAYKLGIKRCGFLKEFDFGFKIFEDIKQNNKSLITPRIYAAIIWLTMEKDFSVESLDKCFNLLNEMQDTFNIQPSPHVYGELIKAATSLRQLKKAGILVKKIMNDENNKMNIFLQYSRSLRRIIINYYAQSKQIEKGLKLMNYLVKEYGREYLDDIIYTQMITGCAMEIKNGNKTMICAAERLFEQSFSILGRSPSVGVFCALLNCYSNVPDIECCMYLLKTMQTKDDWPNPSGFVLHACLKALTEYYYSKPLNYEQGWKYINEILNMRDKMDNMNDKFDNAAIYSLLFRLCGGQFCGQSDLDKLYKYYDEMINNGIKLNPLSATALLMSGIDHYKFELVNNNTNNKQEIKNDLMNYIDWALMQCKKYNLRFTKQQSDKLKQKLSEVM